MKIETIKNLLVDLDFRLNALQKFERKTQILDDLSTRPHLSRLIALLAKSINSKRIIETGTFRGITSANLAIENPDALVYTFEFNKEQIAEAETLFRKMELSNIILIKGDVLAELPKQVEKLKKIDFVFLDDRKANYRKNFESILPKLRLGGIVTAHDTSRIMIERGEFFKDSIKFNEYLKLRSDFSLIEVDESNCGLTIGQKVKK